MGTAGIDEINIIEGAAGFPRDKAGNEAYVHQAFPGAWLT